jgi:Family of unknown function (DUF5302)
MLIEATAGGSKSGGPMADKAAESEGAGGKPGSPDRVTDAGQAASGDRAGQPGSAVSADEVQAGFREALERKRAQEAATAGGSRGKTGGKIHGAHGPAAGRRSFRRQSG